MYHSLKIKPKLSLQTTARVSPRSSPTSPRKFKIQKKVSLMNQGDEARQLWNQSSLSLTREHSPVHMIPNSIRFRPIEDDSLTNSQFMTLELRRDIKTEKGPRFAKSHRPEHFVKGLGQLGPSPASYNCSKFLEQANSSAFLFANPENTESNDNKMKYSIKGRSFSTFQNYHKSYIDHSKHKLYQPQTIAGQPGPGKYNQSFVNKHKKSSYSMRIALKRFNDTTSTTPGPGAYGEVYTDRITSPNAKRTFELSKRTYLTKFQKNPSPNHYSIKRFLENEKTM